jgi:RHS repeat-associated protein
VNRITQDAYDSHGNVTEEIEPDNSPITYGTYNSFVDPSTTTDELGRTTSYSYDAMNRETGTTDAAGSSIAGVTTFTYDAAGNQITSTDPDNDTTTTTYDALDRVSTVKDPDGGLTTYTYDNAGRLHVLTDPVGNATTYTYNGIGEQTMVTSPSVNSGTGVSATFVYDADGELTDTTDADGHRVTYSYDSRGDQTGVSWLNGSGTAIYTATYTFDADKEMTGASDANATLTMAYDSDGWLGTFVTSGPGTGQPTVTLTYSYDGSGDLTSTTDSLSGSGDAGPGITTYAYDNALRLGTITQSLGGTQVTDILDSYDSGGRLTEVWRTTNGSGQAVRTLISYDAANDVTTMVDATVAPPPRTGPPPPSGGSTFDVNYYDPNAAGQVTSQTYNDANSTNTYGYDSSGQLTGTSGAQTYTYSYDLNGNRNSTGYSTGAGNEMTNSPGVTYTYDNDGNMITATTSSGTTTYTYDYENRLTGVEADGTYVATYTYNALGQRIGIKDSGTQTWTVFNNATADANPYSDFNSSGSVSMRYLDGTAVDEVLARTSSGGTTAWYITDKLGSIEDVVSTGGSVQDHIIYDSFGNIVTQTSASNGDRFKFAGMEYDSGAGLYYDHARYYDSVVGRFVSQDSMGFRAGDTNLYRYVGNAPTTAVDVSGHGLSLSPKDPPPPFPVVRWPLQPRKTLAPAVLDDWYSGTIVIPWNPANGGPVGYTKGFYIWGVQVYMWFE